MGNDSNNRKLCQKNERQLVQALQQQWWQVQKTQMEASELEGQANNSKTSGKGGNHLSRNKSSVWTTNAFNWNRNIKSCNNVNKKLVDTNSNKKDILLDDDNIQNVNIQVAANAIVSDVKDQVQKALGPQSNDRNLRLICKGHLLAQDTCALSEFSVQNLDVLHAVLGPTLPRVVTTMRMKNKAEQNGMSIDMLSNTPKIMPISSICSLGGFSWKKIGWPFKVPLRNFD
jgi:hypothetical protein